MGGLSRRDVYITQQYHAHRTLLLNLPVFECHRHLTAASSLLPAGPWDAEVRTVHVLVVQTNVVVAEYGWCCRIPGLSTAGGKLFGTEILDTIHTAKLEYGDVWYVELVVCRVPVWGWCCGGACAGSSAVREIRRGSVGLWINNKPFIVLFLRSSAAATNERTQNS